MEINDLIHYQPRCTSSYQDYLLFCLETPTSNRLVLIKDNNNNEQEKTVVDIYQDGISEVRFGHTTQPILMMLTETSVKTYDLTGKLLFHFDRQISTNLPEFNDRFVSVTMHKGLVTVLTATGSILTQKEGLLEITNNLATNSIALITFQEMLIVSTEEKGVWGVGQDVVQLLIPVTQLPIYFMDSCYNRIILGAISGELLVTALQKQLHGLSLTIILRVQVHTGMMTCLQVQGNSIITGSDDGFVNCFVLDKDKLSLQKSRNLNRIVTGIFFLTYRVLASVYQSPELTHI